MIFYEYARKLNHKLKQKRKQDAGKYLSVVRRIEKTAPLKQGRYVAMTFDDGPNALPPNPVPKNFKDTKGLTHTLLDILKHYDAKGTFDVIGTTEYNYPDVKGKPNSPQWGGIRHDHYPDYKKDYLAGVKNQAEIAKRILEEGSELSNHGYRHVLFGPKKIIYSKREHFNTLNEVVSDLKQLHYMVKDKFDYEMKLSRPPHYVDKINSKYSSYDAYRIMGYLYLAASFDGGGWKPSCGDYKHDVEIMVNPLKEALKNDPDALNGQIIFQKDTANQSGQTPIVDALPKHIKLLKNEGYKIITVSEMLKKAPFEDVDDMDEIYGSVCKLADEGYCIGYKNNTFQPNRKVTLGELAMMITPPEIFKMTIKNFGTKYVKSQIRDLKKTHPYFMGVHWCNDKGYFKSLMKDNVLDIDQHVNKYILDKFLNDICKTKNINCVLPKCNNNDYLRKEIINTIDEIVKN